jgi:hypothetical protein
MARVNLGTARILVIVGLVVAGVIVLANGFGDDASSAAVPQPTGTVAPTTAAPTTSAPTTAAPTQTPSPQVKGVVVMVFNGTTAAGLAAQGQDVLTSAGYSAPYDPADSPVTGIPNTIVYFKGGSGAAQNESDATAMARKYFKGAKVKELGPDYQSVVQRDVQVVVVLGQDYADANAP